MSSRIKFCIVGIPDHQGVFNVGGRLGSGRGPEFFRQAFYKLKGQNSLLEEIVDLGDVQSLTADVSQNHVNAAAFIEEAHQTYPLSLVIGGGHDHGFSHLLGIKKALQKRGKSKIGCINIDAHLDVRKPAPLISSGSPFYLAIESGTLDPSRLIEFGIQSHCNAKELWAYVEKHKIKTIPFQELRNGNALTSFQKNFKKLSSVSDAVIVSLDLDAIAEAFAPGVSAPQSEGFTSTEVIEMVEFAARDKKTVSLGIFELNPEHDFGQRTARLAATTAFHFLSEALDRK